MPGTFGSLNDSHVEAGDSFWVFIALASVVSRQCQWSVVSRMQAKYRELSTSLKTYEQRTADY